MIIHRHKTHEHRSRENNNHDLYGSTAGHCDQPHGSKGQDSGSVAGRKTADVIATLKWMETVRPGADQGWIIVSPGVRPIAAENVDSRDAKIIGNNQADTRDKQRLLPE